MRFGRRRSPYVTTELMLAELRRARRAGGSSPENVDAQLEGLTLEPGRRARLEPREGEPVVRHALYLVGTLIAFAERMGRPFDRTSLSVWVTPYCVGVAERHARHPEKAAPDPHFSAHTYAMVRTEDRVGRPMPVELEEVLGSWLATQQGLRPAEGMPEVLGPRRARRLAKLFPDATPETPAN